MNKVYCSKCEYCFPNYEVGQDCRLIPKFLCKISLEHIDTYYARYSKIISESCEEKNKNNDCKRYKHSF
jgi:hypothetical protein